MSGETEDPETSAQRLEAALERIARLAGGPGVAEGNIGAMPASAEVAARLDIIIERLHAALGGPFGGKP